MEKHMDTPTFNPIDIVKFAAAKDAVNVSAAFDQMIGQRVYDAIQTRKQEIASQMFNEPVEAEQVTDDENAGEEESVEAAAEQGSEAGTEEQQIDQAEESDETAEQNT